MVFDFCTINKIINIVVASAKIQELKLPHISIRPQIHCIITGAIGSTKSSLLNDVCKELKLTPLTNVKPSHLSGTVDKTTGNPIVPITWDNRNTVLPIDELHTSKTSSNREAIRDLLMMLEFPKFQKRVGYRCNSTKLQDKDLFCRIQDGQILIKTRFVFLATTMMPLHKHQQMIELQALKTRCLILPYYPSLKELKLKLSGQEMFKFKKYRPPKKIKISKKDYEIIKETVFNKNLGLTYIMRSVGDLCRIFAVIGKHDFGLYDLILSSRVGTSRVKKKDLIDYGVTEESVF